MSVHPDGKVHLEKVRYTTCPVGNQDWMMQASSLNLDTDAEQGIAHGVVMRFKDVPIFYSPYHRLSAGRRAPERPVVPELRAFRQQRLPARGSLLLQPGAELRPDPDSRTTCPSAACSSAANSAS